MAKKKLLPPALTPCGRCMADVKETTNFYFVACPHNNSVAILPVKNGIPSKTWRIFSPATPNDVAEILKKARPMAE